MWLTTLDSCFAGGMEKVFLSWRAYTTLGKNRSPFLEEENSLFSMRRAVAMLSQMLTVVPSTLQGVNLTKGEGGRKGFLFFLDRLLLEGRRRKLFVFFS
jgi:hypothetical protein